MIELQVQKDLQESLMPLFSRFPKECFAYPFNTPAFYVTNNKVIEGVGWINFIIHVKDDWYVTFSTFMDSRHNRFDKILLNIYEPETRRFTRCHSYYLDEADLVKKGGSLSPELDLYDICTVLIDHAEKHSETDCAGCRGEDPLQTHFIQII